MPTATADIVSRNLWDKESNLKKDEILINVLPGHAELAAKAMEWAQNITDAQVEANEYLYNIRTVARATNIEARLLGYAASIIPAYKREVEKQELRRQEAKLGQLSQHVGAVGDKLENLSITVLAVRETQSDWGVTTMISMVDAAGNRFKWWSSGSGCPFGDVGATACIKGTVKKHDTFRDIKETVLTRCSLFVPKAPKVKKPRGKATQAPVVDAPEVQF